MLFADLKGSLFIAMCLGIDLSRSGIPVMRLRLALRPVERHAGAEHVGVDAAGRTRVTHAGIVDTWRWSFVID